ncbi:LNS2-domain-containing protein [Backusella circina FSU 941]|nr:LNS2-domain-containing protein [Backusella circina FSU 941]
MDYHTKKSLHLAQVSEVNIEHFICETAHGEKRLDVNQASEQKTRFFDLTIPFYERNTCGFTFFTNWSLFTSVHNFYNEINPATLSGAIDIVVVEQPDGDLACSPFHVRFGKLSVLMPQEKKVQIKINGEMVPYLMKVGEAGEAFFVFETEHEVPEEFQTSPIMEAVSEKGDEDPPYLDIGESKDDNTKGEDGTTDNFEDDDKEGNQKVPLPAELQSPKMIIDEQMDKVVTKMDPYHDDDLVVADTEEQQPKNDIYTMDDGSTLLERVIPEAITTTTVAKERFIVRPAAGDIYSTWMDVTHTSVHKRNDDSTEGNNDGRGEESIVLDIAGYKTTGNDKWDGSELSSPTNGAATTVTINEDEPLAGSPTNLSDDMKDMVLDRGIKQDTEEDAKSEENNVVNDDDKRDQEADKEGEKITSDNNNNNNEEEEQIPEQPLQEIPVDIKEKEHEVERDEEMNKEELTQDKSEENTQQSRWGWGATHRRGTNESLPVQQQEEEEAETQLELLPGQTYRIEMSLCGFSAFGKEEAENASLFEKHQTTYDNFTHNPNILNDKRLVFRYQDKYYAANHNGPLLTSLLLFKKPINDTSRIDDADNADTNVSDSRESYQFGRGWRQWLSRSSVAAAVPTHNSSIDNNSESKQDTPEDDDQQVDEDNNHAQLLDEKDQLEKDQQKKQHAQEQETTTFTTTTTTTSVGWSPDHVHLGQEQTESFPGPRKVYAKTLRLTSDQLKSLGLKKGVNTISFSVTSAYQGTAICAAKIFYWDHDIQVVISDIDGTITKSDTLGHVFTMIGKDWTHNGVAKLYTDIANNGYHFLYLTSRAIGQADYTRDYLKKVIQDKYQLPDGPVIMSPDRLFTSLHREVIMRKPEVFKMACLKDIQRLFGGRDPFYAGFGNRITDARSYRSVNVPTSRIFTIDPYGDLKLELLMGFKSSYIHLNDLVDQIFPPINMSKPEVNEEYNDYNYWKSPFPDIDIPELEIPLEPTSPKPKPIKPDPSALPENSVVASKSSRGLLRSFTSRSSTNNNTSSNKKPNGIQSSHSTPNLNTNGSRRMSSPMGSDTESEKLTIMEPSSSEPTTASTEPSSPTTSIVGKISSGVRSTLSRTFLKSPEPFRPENIKEEEEIGGEGDKQEEEEKDVDVDALLDDIDMDEIPFI